MLFADAVFNIFADAFMLRIVFNVFSMMFAKTSLLFCCFCIRLFVTNYVCVVPYRIMRNLDAIIRVVRPRHTMRHVAATGCCNKSPRVTCENHCRTNSNCFEFVRQTKGRDTRCDKSLRHVAATGCCNKSPRVTCGNHCHCNRILSLQSVARIDRFHCHVTKKNKLKTIQWKKL